MDRVTELAEEALTRSRSAADVIETIVMPALPNLRRGMAGAAHGADRRRAHVRRGLPAPSRRRIGRGDRDRGGQHGDGLARARARSVVRRRPARSRPANPSPRRRSRRASCTAQDGSNDARRRQGLQDRQRAVGGMINRRRVLGWAAIYGASSPPAAGWIIGGERSDLQPLLLAVGALIELIDDAAWLLGISDRIEPREPCLQDRTSSSREVCRPFATHAVSFSIAWPPLTRSHKRRHRWSHTAGSDPESGRFPGNFKRVCWTAPAPTAGANPPF